MEHPRCDVPLGDLHTAHYVLQGSCDAFPGMMLPPLHCSYWMMSCCRCAYASRDNPSAARPCKDATRRGQSQTNHGMRLLSHDDCAAAHEVTFFSAHLSAVTAGFICVARLVVNFVGCLASHTTDSRGVTELMSGCPDDALCDI